jgi:hypothetical protein
MISTRLFPHDLCQLAKITHDINDLVALDHVRINLSGMGLGSLDGDLLRPIFEDHSQKQRQERKGLMGFFDKDKGKKSETMPTAEGLPSIDCSLLRMHAHFACAFITGFRVTLISL